MKGKEIQKIRGCNQCMIWWGGGGGGGGGESVDASLHPRWLRHVCRLTDDRLPKTVFLSEAGRIPGSHPGLVLEVRQC